MSKAFANILLPVDFTVNTGIAVGKVFELAEAKDTVIHLLHVATSSVHASPSQPAAAFSSVAGKVKIEEDAGCKLAFLRGSILEMLPGATVELHLVKGNMVQQNIIELAKQLNPQLVIIGKHNYHNWFTFLNTVEPGKIARHSNCPVLTVKTGSLNNKVKSIVFPIRSTVPKRKIEILLTLARKYRATVYLVTSAKESREDSSLNYSAFIETYRILKSVLNGPIEHKVVSGGNFARATLQFANSIKADMILVAPDAETRVSLISGRQVTDMVKGDSKLEILTVEPYPVLRW